MPRRDFRQRRVEPAADGEPGAGDVAAAVVRAGRRDRSRERCRSRGRFEGIDCCIGGIEPRIAGAGSSVSSPASGST